MPIRRSQKKRNAEPRQEQNHRRLVIDPMVNPGSSAHRHQARSKADPTRTRHRMVALAQTRARDTDFHTGDVWKTVLCLKHYRPDLDVFTIATPPTGLTVVTGELFLQRELWGELQGMDQRFECVWTRRHGTGRCSPAQRTA